MRLALLLLVYVSGISCLETCSIQRACHLCSTSGSSSSDGVENACTKTGRVIEFTCYEDDQQQEQTSSIRYESCKRTQEEDEFLLMQFQIVWLVLGGWAVLQVRKQKQSSASLFDQRKQRGGSAAASNDKLRSSERDLELTERQKREERMPLTSYMVTTESSLEVV